MANPLVPFVVGCPRSGTSLLTVLLDRHPSLAMMPETHFLHTFDEHKTGWPLGPTHEQLLISAWHRAWHRLRDLYFEPRQIRERMTSFPCTPEGLLRALLSLWAERAGKPLAGEKTPQYLGLVDRILENIPGSNVTIIIRDGRAVVASLDRSGAHRSTSDHARQWVKAAEKTDRWLREYPSQVRLVHFEELSARPATSLESLMPWYGLTFDPVQLRPQPSSTYRRWEGFMKSETDKEIDTSRGEAWFAAENSLPPTELARLAPWLERFGYPASKRAAPSAPVFDKAPPRRVRSPEGVVTPVLIVGAHRAGTWSLAQWLATRPEVGHRHEPDLSLLLSNSNPTRKDWLEAVSNDDFSTKKLVIEVASYYLAHPLAAEIARKTLPDARIIILLRDPVARAFSHWLSEWRLGTETLPFAQAIAAESVRLGEVERRLAADPEAVSFAHQHYGYVARGRYAEQVQRWYDAFPAEQIAVLALEDVIQDPAANWARLTQFLMLPSSEVPELGRIGRLHWPVTMESWLRTPEAEDLRSHFAAEVNRTAG